MLSHEALKGHKVQIYLFFFNQVHVVKIYIKVNHLCFVLNSLDLDCFSFKLL